MKIKPIFVLFTFLVVIAQILAACAPAATPIEIPEDVEEAEPMEEVAPEEAPEEEAAPAEEFTIDNPKGLKPDRWSDEMTDCSQYASEPPWVIGVSNYGLQNSWRVQMMAELQFAADQDDRIELIITNADGNVAKQVADIGDLLTKDIDALLVLPVSSDGIKPAVDEVHDAGIPVIVFNNELAGDNFESMVWIDEYKFGWIGGKWLDEQLGGEGNVVILEGVPGTSTSDLRTRGAKDAFSPGINVLAQQPADWAYDKGKAVMEDFIAAYPEIDGIYSQGGAMSLGALEALLAAGKPLVPVPSEGNNGFLKFWKEKIPEGYSSIGPDEATWQSSEALRQAVACLEGETIEKWHELPLPVITNDNIDDYVRMDCPDDLWANTQMSDEAITELYKCGE
jgi:ribose transport system substrate-binding protein